MGLHHPIVGKGLRCQAVDRGQVGRRQGKWGYAAQLWTEGKWGYARASGATPPSCACPAVGKGQVGLRQGKWGYATQLWAEGKWCYAAQL